MKTLPKYFLLSIALFAAIFAAGCPERRTIADIERNPGKYQNKDVTIIGVVQDSYGMSIPGTRISGGAYKIDDGTGSIWIVTDGPVPVRGAQMGVEGTIGSGINWKGRNYGLGMYEKKRHYPKR